MTSPMAEATPRGFARHDENIDVDGVQCAAWVYRPDSDGAGPARPAIVMAHGLGSDRRLRLPAYAERFAAAGYIVVVFDYRSFGASGGEPRRVVDVEQQLRDWRTVLARTRELPGVDAERIVAWGTSFAGGHVITLAGSGAPLAAIISQVPHVSGLAAFRATGLRRAVRLAPYVLGDIARSVLGLSPVYVPLIARGSDVAIVSDDTADDRLDRLIEASGLNRGDVEETLAARIGLWIGFYSPVRYAAGVRCPALVQVADGDTIAPAAAACTAASRMRRVTLVRYDADHFEPYTDNAFEQFVADQLDFLHREILVSSTDTPLARN
jgi:fermentation-respiration switch protein FrsA (DUF1100 family)